MGRERSAGGEKGKGRQEEGIRWEKKGDLTDVDLLTAHQEPINDLLAKGIKIL